MPGRRASDFASPAVFQDHFRSRQNAAVSSSYTLTIKHRLYNACERLDILFTVFSVALVHFSDKIFNSQNYLFNLHIRDAPAINRNVFFSADFPEVRPHAHYIVIIREHIMCVEDCRRHKHNKHRKTDTKKRTAIWCTSAQIRAAFRRSLKLLERRL